MGLFAKLMKRMAEYYARECGGIGWKWQAMDSKHSAAPLGGEKTGDNPTDRGKSGAKINFLVDGCTHLDRSQRSQPPRQGSG
jgi:putative transposase